MVNDKRNLTTKTKTYNTIIYISSLLIFSNISLFYLYPIILDSWGSDPGEIGLVMGIFSATAVLSRPIMGRIASIKGEFLIMILGSILILLSSTLYCIIKEVGPILYINRMLHGLGFSGFIAGVFSTLARLTEPSKRGVVFSRMGAFIMGAMAFVPAGGEVLIKRYGFSAFYSFGIIIALASVIFISLIKRRGNGHKTGSSTDVKGYISLIKNIPFSMLLLSTLLFSHMQAGVINFIALFAKQRSMDGGTFFLIAFSTAISILLFSGGLLDRYGIMYFLKIFYLIFIGGILLLPSLITFKGGIIPAIMFGMGTGFVFPSLNALAAGFGKQPDKPRVMSLFTGIYDTGFISGAIITGLVGKLLSMDMMFYTSAIIGLAGAIPILFNKIKYN